MSNLRYGWPDLFGACAVTGCGDGQIEVRPIAKAQADALIRAGHYSRSVVWSSSLHFGVFADNTIIGAIQYGPAMNPASGANIVADTLSDGWLELNRMWLADDKPRYCATRAIAFSLRLIKHLRPSVEWVQSFADSRCGKLGAVYQAASFIYCGSHRSMFYEIDGEWFHKSMKARAPVDSRGWWSGPKIAFFRDNEHRAVVHTFTQYRYLRFLNRRARKRLTLPELPYPKPIDELARTAKAEKNEV
jgi:Enterobacteriaceae phage adenine modification enzyme